MLSMRSRRKYLIVPNGLCAGSTWTGSASVFRRRYELPYGIWTCADGREVLFHRGYAPIYERGPGFTVRPADPTERVPFVSQAWFYSGMDSKTKSRRAAEAVLREWGVPLPPPRYRA